MTVGLTTVFIGPVSQAQRVTITASTVADEEEQKLIIFDRGDSDDIPVTGTEIGALDEGSQSKEIYFFAIFEEAVTLTVTNNNPEDVRFGHSSLLNPPASLTTTLTTNTPSFGYGSSLLDFAPRDNDNIVQGTQTYSLLFAWRPVSSTSTVSGNTASVSFTGIVRDDDGGFTLDPDPFLGATLPDIAEGEEETTFTVVLDGQPSSDVVLTLTSSTQVSLGTTALTFSNGDWDTSQIVTVTSRADNDSVDGDAAYMITVGVNTGSTDDAFDDLADQILSGTVTDNDIAGFTLVPLSGASTLAAIAEGENTTTFTVVLDAQPQSNVVLDLSTTSGDVSLSDTSVSFIPSAWDTPVSVTVTSRVDNNDLDGDAAYTVTVGVNAGSDDSFDSLTAQTLSGMVTDNEMAGFTLAPADSSVLAALAEGANTVTFTLVLDAQPLSNVVFDISTASSDVSLSDTSVSFIPSAWNTPVMVTVTSRADNDNVDGDAAYTVTVSVDEDASHDAFDGLDDQTLNGMVTDDDMAGFTLAPSDGSSLSTISESGSTTFTARLNRGPQTNVTLSITSTDPGEATVSVSTLVFTNTNWGTVQTVSVNGVIDNIVDGPQSYMIDVVVATGSDASYSGVMPQQLNGTVADDDIVGFTLAPLGGAATLAVIDEGENTTTFTVVLDVIPQDNNVVLDLSTTSSAVTLSDTSVSFTPSEWDTLVMVTVTSRADNDDADGDAAYIVTVSVNDGSSDDAFDNLLDQTLSGTVADDETVSLTKEGEVQGEIAVAIADTFGTAQLAADLISTRLQAPLASAPQVSFAGRELHAQGNIPVLVNPVASDPWGDEEEQIQDWNSDFASLLPGTDFVLPLSDSDSAGNQLEFWGSVGYTDLQGDPTVDGVKIDYDGDATGVQVGLSRRDSSGTSLGISVGSTKVDLDLEGKERGDIVKVERELLSFHPYVGWSPLPGLEAWLVGGVGKGDYDMELVGGEQINTEASMLMLSGGIQRSWQASGYDWSGQLTGVITRSKLDETAQVSDLAATAWRARAEFEVGRSYVTAAGQVQPYATVGYRQDGGDIGSSGAGEVGLGLRTSFHDTWAVDVKGRFQITDSDHEQDSYQGYLKYDRNLDRRGLLFSAGHSFENQETDEGISVFTSRLGYGWGRALFGHRGVLGLHVQMDSSVEQRSVVGWSFEAPSLQLGVDGNSDQVRVHIDYVQVNF